MTTRSGLRTTIRTELNDSGGTPVWSTALIDEWINQAIRQYSRELPEEVQATVVVVANQSDYTLPARWLRVTRVEQPEDILRMPISGSRTTGAALGDLVDFQDRVRGTVAHGYRIFGNELILDPAPTVIGAAEDVRLEYTRVYAQPTTDAEVLATPDQDDDVLIALVASMALRWVAMDEAKRVRYQETRGISPGSQAYAYQARAEAAIATRSSRVRTSTLEVS